MHKKNGSFRLVAADSTWLKFVLWVLFAQGASNLAQAQATRQFFDEFTNTSKIQSLSNVFVDVLKGEVTLLSNDSTLSTPGDFHLVLDGIEPFINGNSNFTDIVDIDVDPSDSKAFFITDANKRTIYGYNSLTGRVDTEVNLDTLKLNITPRDIFPYIERVPNTGGERLKVLIAGSRGTSPGSGRIARVDWGRTSRTVDWVYPDSARIANPDLLLDSPEDVTLSRYPNRPNEIIICDTRNNRLLAVNMTKTGDAAVTPLLGAGKAALNNPVDIEIVPSDTTVYLVTDQKNHRVVLLKHNNDNTLGFVWEFGLGVRDASDLGLDTPTDADVFNNGNILICDSGNHRLIEVDRDKKIQYRFPHPLSKVTLSDIADADRIAQRRTIIAARDPRNATRIIPQKLAYTRQDIKTQVFSFGRGVDFETLQWSGIDAVNGRDSTRILLKIRSSNDSTFLNGSLPFLGPNGTPDTNDVYNNPLRVSEINSIHDGHQYYQFLVRLESDNPLKTPELSTIQITAHFVRFEQEGILVSVPIQAPQDSVITKWNSLSFPNSTSVNEGQKLTVEILDPFNRALASFDQSESFVERLGVRVPELVGKQTLRLRARLQTQARFLTTADTTDTPRLLSWRVFYEVAPISKSTLSFTDKKFAPVEKYKFASVRSDSVYITLTDFSRVPFLDATKIVPVTVKSSLTEDSLSLNLTFDPTSVASFRGGVPAAFKPSRANDTLEVKERDVLIVRYRDPNEGDADVSTDTARVFRNTSAQIRIESLAGQEIDSIFVDNFFIVRVLGEKDQDLSATKADTILAKAFVERRNGEEEMLRLIETGDTTGTFVSLPVQVRGERTAAGDRRLRVFNADDVVAEYSDPDNRETVSDAIKVFGAPPDTDSIFASDDLFNFVIAPNPYRTYQHSALKLAAKVRNGKTLVLEQVEIFNLSGEKITSIPEGRITFAGSNMVTGGPSVTTTGWWNRQNDAGSLVASGTYFVKFHARITDNTTQRTDNATLIRKLVLVQ